MPLCWTILMCCCYWLEDHSHTWGYSLVPFGMRHTSLPLVGTDKMVWQVLDQWGKLRALPFAMAARAGKFVASLWDSKWHVGKCIVLPATQQIWQIHFSKVQGNCAMPPIDKWWNSAQITMGNAVSSMYLMHQRTTTCCQLDGLRGRRTELSPSHLFSLYKQKTSKRWEKTAPHQIVAFQLLHNQKCKGLFRLTVKPCKLAVKEVQLE